MNRSQHGDGLDPANWEILCAAVIAAHNGDIAAARAVTRRLDTDVPVDGQAGTYLWYLLRYHVVEMLGRRPSAEDLRTISARFNFRFSSVIGSSEGLMENVLRTVFKLASSGEEVTAGSFIVAGTTALGVLLNDPVADMETMRPHLAVWWRRNLPKFRDQGILADRRER